MAPKSKAGIDPNFYAGVIEAGARQGLRTEQIWGLIREQATHAGLTSPGITAQAVSRIRGGVGGNLRTERVLAGARGDIGIDASMIGQASYARSLAERNALPMFSVRFVHHTMGPDGPNSDYRTVMFTGTLPNTVEALRQRIEAAASQMARDYGLEHVGADGLQLVAV